MNQPLYLPCANCLAPLIPSRACMCDRWCPCGEAGCSNNDRHCPCDGDGQVWLDGDEAACDCGTTCIVDVSGGTAQAVIK